MANGGSSRSSSITPSQFDQLMKAISGIRSDTEAAIEQKMAQLKQELVEEHKEVNEHLAKSCISTHSQSSRKMGTRSNLNSTAA